MEAVVKSQMQSQRELQATLQKSRRGRESVQGSQEQVTREKHGLKTGTPGAVVLDAA
jgi:hypothetical protein